MDFHGCAADTSKADFRLSVQRHSHGGKWRGCTGWQRPTGSKVGSQMNVLNEKKMIFYAQQFLNY
jgi:hypothetical protein